jgi:ATP-dependent exoDNAse (exonuclease V) beta subunit
VPDPDRVPLDPQDVPRVELALFPSKDPARGEGDPDARRLEAAWVAGRIRSMLDEGQLIYDPRAGERRAVRLSDFAILLRTAGRIAVFETALAEQGLAFYTEAGKGYFAEEEVAEVCAYLRVLVQPEDDEALLVALRSPFAGLSFDALWQLRQAGRHAPLWQAVLGRADVGLTDDDLARLDAFVDRTGRARDRLGRLPLARILEWLFAESGYDVASLLRGAGGPRRWANLRKLMDLAIAFEDMEGADPLGFVRFVQTQEELGTREGAAPVAEEATEAVRIMTIHAAKGSEFKVVFLADTGSKSGGGGRDRVIWRPGPGVDAAAGVSFAMRLKDASELGGDGYKTAGFTRLSEARKADDLAEEARCLYVAMTRAEQRLFVTGHLDLDKKADTWTSADIDRIAGALGITRQPKDDAGRRALAEVPDPRVIAVSVVRPADAAGEPWAAGLTPGAGEDAPSSSARLESALAEVAGAPLPFEPARPPRTHARASFSALADFAACPYRYHLTRVAGLGEMDALPGRRGGAGAGGAAGAGKRGPTRAKTAVDPRALGIAVHAVLERADLAGPPPDREVIAAALADEVAALGDGANGVADEGARGAALDRVAATRAATVERAAALIAAFWVSPTAERIRVAQAAGARIARELPFAVAVGETVLGGVIDAAVLPADGGPARIVDYKTNHLEGTSPGELFEARYGEQVEAYALALLAAGHEAVEVEIVFLEAADSPVVRTFKAGDIVALTARIADRLEALGEGPYRPLDAYDPDACPGCPGLAGLCPV